MRREAGVDLVGRHDRLGRGRRPLGTHSLAVLRCKDSARGTNGCGRCLLLIGHLRGAGDRGESEARALATPAAGTGVLELAELFECFALMVALKGLGVHVWLDGQLVDDCLAQALEAHLQVGRVVLVPLAEHQDLPVREGRVGVVAQALGLEDLLLELTVLAGLAPHLGGRL